jgi:hypothetical protein
MSDPTPAGPRDVCGATIPAGHAVFTRRDALAGPVVVMCRDCDALVIPSRPLKSRRPDRSLHRAGV